MKNWPKYKVTNFLMLLFLTSCFEEYTKFEYSYPNRSSVKKVESHTTLTILYTNNFKNQIDATKESYPNDNNINVGGKEGLKSYISILRKKFKNPILLDAGNMLDRQASPDAINGTINLYNELDYDAVLLTENEILNLKNDSDIKFPFVSTNIIDLKKETESDFLNNKSYLIKEIDGIKLGIVGLTLYKKNSNISGIIFDDPVARLISVSSLIRDKVDAIVLLIHPTSHCNDYYSCKSSGDEITSTIERLPPGSVDLVIGGEVSMGKTMIDDYNVAQNFGRGQFIGVSTLHFDESKKLLSDKTQILSPLKVCSHYFDATADCHIEIGDGAKRNLIRESKYKLISPRILGTDI